MKFLGRESGGRGARTRRHDATLVCPTSNTESRIPSRLVDADERAAGQGKYRMFILHVDYRGEPGGAETILGPRTWMEVEVEYVPM